MSRRRSEFPSRPANGDRPVEFWPTSAIRSVLEGGDIGTWKQIAVAIKRDPFGRTARQVEEVLETSRPYGISKALAEVLESRPRALGGQRAQRGSPACAGVGSTLGTQAARVRIPDRGARRRAGRLSGRHHQSVGVVDDPDASALRSFRQGPVPPTAATAAATAARSSAAVSGHQRQIALTPAVSGG